MGYTDMDQEMLVSHIKYLVHVDKIMAMKSINPAEKMKSIYQILWEDSG